LKKERKREKATPSIHHLIPPSLSLLSLLPSFPLPLFSVDGQDVVYKDIIEPLESVSVSITSTDKATVDDFGPPEEVAATLATKVLTPASQQVKVLSVSRRVVDGRPYVDFEFAAKAPTYIRHALASVSVANGKFYTLTTGANDLRRWAKVKGTLESVVASFKVVDRY